jgi:hypothetical protein
VFRSLSFYSVYVFISTCLSLPVACIPHSTCALCLSTVDYSPSVHQHTPSSAAKPQAAFLTPVNTLAAEPNCGLISNKEFEPKLLDSAPRWSQITVSFLPSFQSFLNWPEVPVLIPQDFNLPVSLLKLQHTSRKGD